MDGEHGKCCVEWAGMWRRDMEGVVGSGLGCGGGTWKGLWGVGWDVEEEHGRGCGEWAEMWAGMWRGNIGRLRVVG